MIQDGIFKKRKAVWYRKSAGFVVEPCDSWQVDLLIFKLVITTMYSDKLIHQHHDENSILRKNPSVTANQSSIKFFTSFFLRHKL